MTLSAILARVKHALDYCLYGARLQLIERELEAERRNEQMASMQLHSTSGRRVQAQPASTATHEGPRR